jgi:hypothetical protein
MEAIPFGCPVCWGSIVGKIGHESPTSPSPLSANGSAQEMAAFGSSVTCDTVRLRDKRFQIICPASRQ